jgi:hypothetical protein
MKDDTATAADAVSTGHQSSTEIAAAVAAALVAAGISVSTGDSGKGKKNAAAKVSKKLAKCFPASCIWVQTAALVLLPFAASCCPLPGHCVTV